MQDSIQLHQSLSSFPLSHHPPFIVPAVRQTVSKHYFRCVLQCVVNNTESSTDLQSANCDGGKANSAATASVILKPEDWTRPPLLHPLSCPLPSFKPEWLFHICSCQSLRSSCVYLHTYAHVGKLTALFCEDMSLPVTVHWTVTSSNVCSGCSHTW